MRRGRNFIKKVTIDYNLLITFSRIFIRNIQNKGFDLQESGSGALDNHTVYQRK